MSVFPFPAITPSESSVSLKSNTAANASPHTGKVQTVDRQGEYLRLSMTFSNLTSAERSRLQAFIARLNGQQHRFTCRDHSYTPRGVLSVSEMIDVAFNATNWSTFNADRGSISDVDSGVRFRVGTTQTADIVRVTSGADGISAPTAAKSYVATMDIGDGRPASDGGAAPSAQIYVRQSSFSNLLHPAQAAISIADRVAQGFTAPSASSVYPQPSVNTGGSGVFGSSIELRNLSVARALLVDNGFNGLTYSEEFDNAAWTKTRTTINANQFTAPDGSVSADWLVEDSSGSSHYVYQDYTRTSLAEFWTGSVYIRSNTSRRIRLVVDDGTFSNYAEQYFDATSGTQTATAAVVGSATNVFATMHDVGDGWYRCRLTVRLPATTTARLAVYLCDGATNTTSFTGDGSSSIGLWGAQMQRGGQLGRYTPTTSAATTGAAQTGKQIWVKGLDANTAGQRKVGDQVEINGHLAVLTSDLDGDESGCGLLEISPRIPTAPSDEDGVILYQPHGKWILEGVDNGWSNRPGVFSDFTITAMQDLT